MSPPVRVGWLLAGSREVPEDDGWLAAEERRHAASFHFPHRRADWRLGRWAAKQAVALQLGRDLDPAALARIAIHPDPGGAPTVFLDGAPAPIVVSFGHRAGRAACAVAPAGTALGCDLELVEPRSEAFVSDFFTASERDLVEEAPAADRPLLANLIWSAKESALKALREGLRMDTREVEVSFPTSDAAAGWSPLAMRRSATGAVFHGWWRREGGFVVTLAAAPPPGPPARLGR